MHIPEKRICDLCKADLTGPSVTMYYPLDDTDRQQIDAHVPAAFRTLGRLFDVGPRAWRFDFCRGCVEGLFPMLADLKTSAVRAWLLERDRRASLVADGEPS